MPHTIFVPSYDEDGRLIKDQRRLRILNEERTPEIDQLAHESLKAKDEAAKAARIQAKQREKEEKEFQAGAQAAAQYGIAPQALKPAGLDIAQMLDTEQEMNAQFEVKKQELAQKYQGPDAGNIARELDELHQKQDAELAAKFGNNPMAEQVIGQRNQEFRTQASNWLQSEISTKQQQYFDAVDKKCNDALAVQLSAMQPEQISNALSTRESEMRALGRTNEQIQATRKTLLGSYFQNLATTNPSAFLEATKQPQTDTGNGEAGNHADNSNAPSLQNSLADLAKDLSEEQLGKFFRLAERAQVTLEKKEKSAKINFHQQEILQSLTGLDSEYQRTEIDKITAGMEDQEMASQIKTRLNLQLDYEDRIKAAKDWEAGDKIMAQDMEPLQRLEAIATADISEEAREALIKEVMGEPTPETPENQQATLDTILKIDSSGVQSEQQLYALCQQQGLTRNQAAFLKDTLVGKGRINGVPVGMAMQALRINNPAFADNPAGLLNATEQLVREWPEGKVNTVNNVMEQAEYLSRDRDIGLAKPFEELLKEHGIIPDKPNDEFVGLLTSNLPEKVLEEPEIKLILGLGAEDELTLLEELDKLEERQMITQEQRENITLLFIQHQGERTNIMPLEDKLNYVDSIMKDYANPARQKQLYAELGKKDPKAVFLDDKDMFAMLSLTHGSEFAKDYARFQQDDIQRKQTLQELSEQSRALGQEIMRIGTGNKKYLQLREEKGKIDAKLNSLETKKLSEWEKLKADYPFQRAVSEEFYQEQEQMGNQWKNALQARSGELDAYAGRIREIWQDKKMPEEQRKQLARKELEGMLNFAMTCMNVRDTNGKPIKGKLELRDFGPGVNAGGMTTGSNISINERLIFENENIDFNKVLGTLFHESSHVYKNNMTPERRRQAFGSNADCYMQPSVSNDLYRLQPTELHGFFLETFAKNIMQE